jgi:hypothetical protein
MITQARIREDLKPAGLDWVTALRAPAIQALAANGPLQVYKTARPTTPCHSRTSNALVFRGFTDPTHIVEFTVMPADLSTQSNCGMFLLSTPYIDHPAMTSDVDRKTYWDLLETLRWICTRDEQLVAAMWDLDDDTRMALALFGIKVPRGIRSPPGLSRTTRGADLDPAAPQCDGRTSIPGLDDLLRKVHSRRVQMTAIRCDVDSERQIRVPLAELNDLRFRLVPGHRVAPVGLWSRSRRDTLVWKSPQFLRADVISAWPPRNTKTTAVSAAILRHLRGIMSPEAPLTKIEASRRCLAEVPNAYPGAFAKAWAELEPSCKRGRGKHGPRG